MVSVNRRYSVLTLTNEKTKYDNSWETNKTGAGSSRSDAGTTGRKDWCVTNGNSEMGGRLGIYS